MTEHSKEQQATQEQHAEVWTPTDVLNETYQDFPKGPLIEQYKQYVEMHDKVVERRGKTNTFYLSLLSGSLAFVTLLTNEKISTQTNSINPFAIVFVVSFLGLILCFLWYWNIHGYAALISRKIKVIHEMEKYLPFYSYCREASLWKEETSKKASLIPKSLKISTIEQFVAIAFGTIYISLLGYSVIGLLN